MITDLYWKNICKEYGERSTSGVICYLCNYKQSCSLCDKFFKIPGAKWDENFVPDWYSLTDERSLNYLKYITENGEFGKWMVFVRDKETSLNILQKASDENICSHMKMPDFIHQHNGPICFYCDAADYFGHLKILLFMIENHLIRRKKDGGLYNISFKLDNQTHNNEYGSSYNAKIQLSDIINPYTLLPNIEGENSFIIYPDVVLEDK